MKNYTESNYYFYQTSISSAKNDTLILERKTLFSYSKDIIPLVAFSPESKVVRKKISMLARWLLTMELIAIVGFFVSLFHYPNFLFSIINVPLALIFIFAIVLASVFYYISETKSRIYLYYHNDQPAIILTYHINNFNQKKWIDDFTAAIKNARINFDKNNFIKIQNGIDSLEKQNIISKQFAEELHHRMSDLASINIK